MKSDVDRDEADGCQKLPEHLIYDILLKLPATTLIRFRCLSKQFCRTISTLDFRKHHFLAASRRSVNVLIHFWSCKENNVFQFQINENLIASWTEDVRNSRFVATRTLPSPVTLRIPVRTHQRRPHVIQNSCHGMLCLRFTGTYYHHPYILVWNPVTRQSVMVLCPAAVSHEFSPFVGFGYDDVRDDYKMVIPSFDYKDSVYRAHIMSLKGKMRRWRMIDIPACGTCISDPVTIGGDIYWISFIKSKYIINENYWASQNLTEDLYCVVLKFNVTAERLTVLPSPFEKIHSVTKCMKLGQYRGSVCFFSIDLGLDENENWANIWSLGKDETWKSVMDVPYSPFLRLHGRNCKCEFTTSEDLIICSDGYGLLVYLAQEKKYLEVHLNEDHAPLKLMRADGFSFLQNQSLLSPLVSKAVPDGVRRGEN